MNHITGLLDDLRKVWSVPRHATHSGQRTPVPLVCSFRPPSSASEIEEASAAFPLPRDLIDFWQASGEASLFEDAQYGQWGLRLLSPVAAVNATIKFAGDRAEDYAQGDLVIGEFLGDSDLLVIRCDPSLDSYGAVLIALPLDDRSDWDAAATSLQSFLEKYTKAQGEKFWKG